MKIGHIIIINKIKVILLSLNLRKNVQKLTDFSKKKNKKKHLL